MKRNLQKLGALIAILFVPFFLFAQDKCCVLSESFENGIPAEWTQESVKGAINWVVESGTLSDPADAFVGEHRLAFRNTTGTTLKEKTLLVLPPVDLTSLYQPILTFAHAQAGDNLGDRWIFDTLKVYFRTSVTAEWSLLESYDYMIESWQSDTLILSGNEKSYQIAFEAIDNNSRGIVLDEIQIRSTPTCAAPELTGVENLTNISADISFFSRMPSSILKVSDVPLTAAQLADANHKANIVDTEVTGYFYSVTGLTPNVTYYYYMRSVCECESSSWVSDKFTTSQILITPYFEDFNGLESTPGEITETLVGWFGVGNETCKPYVNTGAVDAVSRASLSSDSSYVLCFNGDGLVKNKNIGKVAIPSAATSYIAMPPFDVDVNRLYLSFRTIRPYGYDISETNSIVVGVMSNTADKATFVPVDTVRINTLNKFEEAVVSFADYQGDGKYITFMSNFAEETNTFFIDDLYVDVIPTDKPTKVGVFKMEILTSDSIRFHFDVKYDKYEVLLAREPQEDLDNVSGADIIRQEITNDAFVKVEPSTEYYVYARAINGAIKGEWTQRSIIRTPGYVDWMPYEMDFTATKSDSSSWYTPTMYYKNGQTKANIWLSPDMIASTETWTKTTFPYIALYEKPTGYLDLSYDNMASLVNRLYAIFPEMINPKDTRVSFYASGVNTSNESTQGLRSVMIVGVMSDANDISTFQIIDTITPGWDGGVFISSQKYFYYYDLANYDVEGKYFALFTDSKFVDAGGRGSIHVDDVTFAKKPSCEEPTNFVVTPSRIDPSKVTITWDANGNTSWEVRVTANQIPFNDVDVVEPSQYVFNATVTTNSVEVTGLRHPNFEYYYTVRPTCDKGRGEWTYFESFRTDCYEFEPIPYIEDFDCESYVLNVKNGQYGKAEGFEAVCMTSTQLLYSGGTSYWPHVALHDAERKNVMRLQKQSEFAGKIIYAALPKMEAKLDTLQVSFKMFCQESGQQVVIGAMTDPTDTMTIEEIAVVKPKILREWREYIVSLENYKGSAEYIVFYVNDGCTSTRLFEVDDIKVEYLNPCARPEDVELLGVSESGATLTWKSSRASKKWRLIVAIKELSEYNLRNPKLNRNIIRLDTVTQKTVDIDGLDAGVQYYFYVQPLCGEEESEAGIWSEVLSFTTRCAAVTAGNFEYKFEGIGVSDLGKDPKEYVYPECWIVGNRSTEITFSDAYVPYVDDTNKKGKASLYVKSNVSNNGAFAIPPRVNIDDISNLRVNFEATAGTQYASHAYAHAIEVGVITDPLYLDTYVPLDTLNITREWLPLEVYLDEYTADYNDSVGKYIMFRSEYGLENHVWIDNITLDTIPECYAKFKIGDITPNTVELRFGANCSSYQVKYATELCNETKLNGNTLDSIDVAGNNVVIGNLEPRTTYYIYTRAKCGDSYSNWSAVKTARTECIELLNLPYSDNFDNQLEVNGLPECWYSNMLSTQEISLYSSQPYSGTRCVIFRKANCLVTPEINVDDLSTCQVLVRIKSYNDDVDFTVGVVSDLNDISGTFVPVETKTIPGPEQINNGVWQLYTFSLANYTGTGKYVAFTNNGGATVFIDNIEIEIINSCERPSACELVDQAQTTLSFKLQHKEASTFDVKYGPTGFDFATEGTLVQNQTRDFTLSGLEPRTMYDVYVRSMCSADTYSDWLYAGAYLTVGELLTIPYETTFDSEEDNAKWLYKQAGQSNKWFIGTDIHNVVNDGVANGGKALFITKDNGQSAQYINTLTSISWAYRTIELVPGDYNISFDWTCHGLDDRDYMRVGLIPYSSKFDAGNTAVSALDGSNGYMVARTTSFPKGWIELSANIDGVHKLNGSDITKDLNEQWTTTETSFNITPETAGIYNLVFFWFNRGESGNEYASTRSAVIDNLSIERGSCSYVYNLQVDGSISTDSVDLVWKYTDNPVAYNVLVSTSPIDWENIPEEGLGIDTIVTTTNKAKLVGLGANITYYAYVQAVCNEYTNGVWSDPVVFTTACLPAPTDSVFDFEKSDKHNLTYNIPSCFIVGHDKLEYNVETSRYFPRLIKNISSSKETRVYSRSGEYAMCLEHYDNNAGGYLVLPLIDADIQACQIKFWMRPIFASGSGSIAKNYVGSTYSREVTVGTMTDPNDPTTFKAIATIEYSHDNSYFSTHTSVQGDPNRLNYWEEVTVPLKDAVGDYIVIKNTSSDGLVNNVMYIDDVVVNAYSCPSVMGLSVSNITSKSAVIDCQYDPDVQYKLLVNTVMSFSEHATPKPQVFDVQSFPYKVENLKPATQYHFMVYTVCDGVTAPSAVNSFVTSQVLAYDQTFDIGDQHSPNDWMRANSPSVTSQFANNNSFNYLANYSANGSWSTQNVVKLSEGGLFSTRHTSIRLEGGQRSTTAWLFSPVLELSNNPHQYVTFDLALTSQGAKEPIATDSVDNDDRFMVIVSEDAGKTWKRTNATVWGTTADDYVFKNIPHTGKQYSVDLSKYSGKQIQVAFYAEANSAGLKSELHLDNVHFNVYHENNLTDNICSGEGYKNYGFTVKPTELVEGNNIFTRWNISTKPNVADTMHILNLYVNPVRRLNVSDTICEGDVYIKYGFNQTDPGEHIQKLKTPAGCDSFIVLNLTVIPLASSVVYDTICNGSFIMWGDQKCTEAGEYRKNVPSTTAPCDSLVILKLAVLDAKKTELSVNICHGGFYMLGEEKITETGRYEAHFETVDGCDSIVTLKAVVLPDYRQTINAVIKKGEEYNGNGFEGLIKQDTYILPLKSKDGCDSTITLNLTVLSSDTTYVEKEITTDDLPYEYETLIYDETTQPGTYVDTIVVTMEDGSEYVIVHTLTIVLADAVQSVDFIDLMLVPNPLTVNSTLYINAEFSASEREGLVVEVFNSVGQIIYRDEPTEYPITVAGLNQRGLYIVRILTAEGKSYSGKVIVE